MKVTEELQTAALECLADGYEIVYSTKSNGNVVIYKLEDFLAEEVGKHVYGNDTGRDIYVANIYAGIKYIGKFIVKKPARTMNQCLTYTEFRARIKAVK